MAGHRPWSEIKHKTPDTPETRAEREAGIVRLVADSDAYEQSLAELRRARAFTQSTLGQALGVSQAQVSRIESQTDLYLSTLANYLEAMGGRLELVGVFDGETRVTLSVGDVTGDPRELAHPA
jgi:DNA-binding XRE family transcriptional regulator